VHLATVLFAATVAVTPTPPLTAGQRVTVGYCSDDLDQAKAAGFDYAELGVRNFAALSEEDFAALLRKKKDLGMETPAGNVFLPNDVKVVGPEVDEARQMAYVKTAFARAEQLDLRTIVFGSGGARRAPEGFPRDKAFAQLVAFVKRILPEARAHHVLLAVEPLRTEETNMINSVKEGLEWVRAISDPSFQVMVDFYHLASVNEDPRVLLEAKPVHIHFANPKGRVFPRDAAEFDYAPFFEVLRKIGYHGGVSIEARTDDFSNDAPKAIAFLRQAFAPGAGR
jgi:D-psicose/D-tagatose/L-ribulose 3-epimerase